MQADALDRIPTPDRKRRIAGAPGLEDEADDQAGEINVLGSCVGPFVAYRESPRWFIHEVTPEQAAQRSFYVAYTVRDGRGTSKLRVTHLAALEQERNGAAIELRMENPRQSVSFDGDGGAQVVARDEPDGTQVVTVFMIGDTPWSSVSEYRVAGDRVYPMRHAHSAAWLLIFVVVLPWLVARSSRSLKRAIDRRLGVREAR